MKKSKCAGLAEEIGFSAPNLSSLPWQVKVATQLCTSKKECNKLDLTVAQYFSLVDHNDSSRWFAIRNSDVCAIPVTVLLVGLPKKKGARLGHLIFKIQSDIPSTSGDALSLYQSWVVIRNGN